MCRFTRRNRCRRIQRYERFEGSKAFSPQNDISP
jgi:hypothetical protein